MITIKTIDKDHQADINIKNEPFRLFGQMTPSYNSGRWDHSLITFAPENHAQMCFPDENYNYDRMSKDHIFLGAYDEETCIGLAILRQAMMKYMYLYDLKVNSEYRGKGVGTMLIEEAKKIALEQGYRGIYTQGQDNNLGACMFYLKCGFEIGGLDTRVYTGTSQEGKKILYSILTSTNFERTKCSGGKDFSLPPFCERNIL